MEENTYCVNVKKGKVTGVYMLDKNTNFVHPIFCGVDEEYVVVKSIKIPYKKDDEGMISFTGNESLSHINESTEEKSKLKAFKYAKKMFFDQEIDVKNINESGEYEIVRYGDFEVVNSKYGVRLLNASIFMNAVDKWYVEWGVELFIEKAEELKKVLDTLELYKISSPIFSKYLIAINYNFTKGEKDE